MKEKVAEEEKRGNRHFSHFSPEANELGILESVFEEYGRTGSAKTRHYVHDEREAELYGAAPGTFTEWADLPPSDLLFYEGLHGCIVTGSREPASPPRPEDRRRTGHQSGMDSEDPPRQGGRAATRPKR